MFYGREPCDDVYPRFVATVRIENKYTPEAMVNEAAGDVEHIVDKCLILYVDPAREVSVVVSVVRTVAMIVRWHPTTSLGTRTAVHLATSQPIVASVMRAGEGCVFYRGRGDQDDAIFLDYLTDLGPAHLLVTELRTRHTYASHIY
jgi:hypothetical protein